MKREFPSTPDEAFEASNEGVYYGKQIVEARQQGRIRTCTMMLMYPSIQRGTLGITIQQPSGSFSNVVKRFTFSIIMRTNLLFSYNLSSSDTKLRGKAPKHCAYCHFSSDRPNSHRKSAEFS